MCIRDRGHLVLSRQAFLGPAEINQLRRFPAVTLDAQHSRVYPLDGVGACDFVNPFANTSDCVQYTGKCRYQ